MHRDRGGGGDCIERGVARVHRGMGRVYTI